MDLGLKGKVMIVTGGAKGIGSGCCTVLAEEGANLVVNYRSDPELCEAFIQKLRDEHGIKAIGVQADVGTKEGRKAILDAAMSEFGTVDGLVNNAGRIGRNLLENVTETEWQEFVAVNLTAPMELTRDFIAICREQKKTGRIVNVIAKAIYGLTDVGMTAYTTTKGGLASFTRSMAKEAAPHGVIINGIVPGYVNASHTNFDDGAPGHELRREKLPTKKFANPREMGDMVAFLLSERASQTIGAIIDVTGGLDL